MVEVGAVGVREGVCRLRARRCSHGVGTGLGGSDPQPPRGPAMSSRNVALTRPVVIAWAVVVVLLAVEGVVIVPTWVRPRFGFYARPGPPIFAVEITVASLAGWVALTQARRSCGGSLLWRFPLWSPRRSFYGCDAELALARDSLAPARRPML